MSFSRRYDRQSITCSPWFNQVFYEATMKKALVFCLMLLLSPLMLPAQVSNNTALVGTIVDPSGGVVVGAKVVGVNVDTKVSYPGTTNSEGFYSIPFVAPGTYNVTAQAPGFQKAVTSGVIVTINIAVRTAFTLSIGSATTEV